MSTATSTAPLKSQADGKPGMISQYLIFSLGKELFAVGTLRVREIIEYGNLTSVPMMPSFIRGVINLRGAVVPVIDLNARFGRARTEISRRTCIVILEVQSDEDTHVLGIVVDAVSAVRQIDSASIEPPPSFGTRIRADFIDGMAKINNNFVILLDLGKVLSVDEISVLNGITTSNEAQVTAG
ncbi:MAG: purine-binding chemotaxis protein CheW [Aquabacterium sp.]|uniref:chemotaxis protein CheW n=1 Tax=Aquabacterium sp. TaxID=1872578 RepID=UPI0025C4E070|nr:chemotaxis protein CheW [Aquabacterium sp.]MBI5924689.1 purine-binding chemotaxis protein CheW [Aquabacterium sp.]